MMFPLLEQQGPLIVLAGTLPAAPGVSATAGACAFPPLPFCLGGTTTLAASCTCTPVVLVSTVPAAIENGFSLEFVKIKVPCATAPPIGCVPVVCTTLLTVSVSLSTRSGMVWVARFGACTCGEAVST